MIIGEHTRENDLEVNVLKGKKLTNIRTTSKDEAVRLTPPIRMTLERSLAWIDDDELVEVTPKSIRLRKTHPRPERAQALAEDQGGSGLSLAAADAPVDVGRDAACRL
jgi:GTP-binding protein